MYYKFLTSKETDNELVALLDTNRTRMERAKEVMGLDLPTYLPHQFEEMVKNENVQGLVVTSPDYTHDEYIIKGLRLGLRVITEKPMTTDEYKCKTILDTVKETGNDCIVTFNYRYSPYRAKLKELLQEETIGKITMVDFHWYLDTSHGADYFRRWHREASKSGTLLVHKATHHFDLVNWWLAARPVAVAAFGANSFYNPSTSPYSTRCKTCPRTSECRFFMNLEKNDHLKALYLDAEAEDGYFRDRCVFSPEINIWDTETLIVRYDQGQLLSYSLYNYAPYEGYRIAFVGTKGRIEQEVIEAAYVKTEKGVVRKASVRSRPWCILCSQNPTRCLRNSTPRSRRRRPRMLRELFATKQEGNVLPAGRSFDGAMSIRRRGRPPVHRTATNHLDRGSAQPGAEVIRLHRISGALESKPSNRRVFDLYVFEPSSLPLASFPHRSWSQLSPFLNYYPSPPSLLAYP